MPLGPQRMFRKLSLNRAHRWTRDGDGEQRICPIEENAAWGKRKG
jgi:hypothetical protein